jgi:putative FmdB family regulatory protein
VPLYDYRCADCGAWDRRIGGLDDHTALCSRCRGLMMRVTEDIYQGYFVRTGYASEKAQNQ